MVVTVTNQVFGSNISAVHPTVTSGEPRFDFTIAGSNNHRPLTLTEKVFTDNGTKTSATTSNHRNEPIKTAQQQGLLQ